MIESGRVLDRLCSEKPCTGAIFTTFGHDPAFFENQVLRSILRLTSDPVEQPQRFHSEALRTLQETPVAVIVDAGQRQPGRRLPYDVLEVSDIVFHPKSALHLYEDYARLMVGSGNLTFPGYSQNTELFITYDLRYDSPDDVELLREFDGHVNRIESLVRQTGSQLSLVRGQLQRRISGVVATGNSPTVALLDSTKSPIMDQILELIPESAKINHIGMLAPFYQRDDSSEIDASSVFGALRHRVANNVSLDVGVVWDNAQVQRDSSFTELNDGLNQLWAWSVNEGEDREIEYLIPTTVHETRLDYQDGQGKSRREDLDEALDAIENGELWMLPKPRVYAPRQALNSANDVYENVDIWLHPGSRLVKGRPVHRPLHAKLLTITYRQGRSTRTLVMIGSANMSRRALLQQAAPRLGNVELGVAFIVNGRVNITDILPELVNVPLKLLQLDERPFPEPGTNWSLAIEQVQFDPKSRVLKLQWSELASELFDWQVLYNDRELVRGSVAPTSDITINDFVLQPASAEIVLRVAGTDYSIPILVTDLVALPVFTSGGGLQLKDLLLLLGRRIGREKAVEIGKRPPKVREDGKMAHHFGEGFSPTDVFRAWWAVAQDLADPELSLLGFRLRLEGALGLSDAWKCIVDAAREKAMNTTEAWFYGAELIRELKQIELEESADYEPKMEVLNGFLDSIRSDLQQIAPDDAGRRWVKTIQRFYAGASK
ncbi:phospholipase D-like domain-containing protein [Mariniblastus fucicola]|nr:hypothetical protein [Mariniblastus fucicola]